MFYAYINIYTHIWGKVCYFIFLWGKNIVFHQHINTVFFTLAIKAVWRAELEAGSFEKPKVYASSKHLTQWLAPGAALLPQPVDIVAATKCHHHDQMWLVMAPEIEVARYAPLPKLPQAAERVAPRNETSLQNHLTPLQSVKIIGTSNQF